MQRITFFWCKALAQQTLHSEIFHDHVYFHIDGCTDGNRVSHFEMRHSSCTWSARNEWRIAKKQVMFVLLMQDFGKAKSVIECWVLFHDMSTSPMRGWLTGTGRYMLVWPMRQRSCAEAAWDRWESNDNTSPSLSNTSITQFASPPHRLKIRE